MATSDSCETYRLSVVGYSTSRTNAVADATELLNELSKTEKVSSPGSRLAAGAMAGAMLQRAYLDYSTLFMEVMCERLHVA